MDEDLAGVGDCAWRRWAERAAAGVACNAEIRAGGDREINALVDDEGEGHCGAGAGNGSRGKDDIAAELARDAVAGVGEREVAEAVDGNAAGGVERSAKGGVAVLGGAIETGGSVGQT